MGSKTRIPGQSWLSQGYQGGCSEEPTAISQSTEASPPSGASNLELHIIPELAKALLKQERLAMPRAWDCFSFSKQHLHPETHPAPGCNPPSLHDPDTGR